MSIDSVLGGFLACLCGGLDPVSTTQLSHPSRDSCHPYQLVDDKHALTDPPVYSDKPSSTPAQKGADEEAAAKVIAILRNTNKTGAALKAELDEITQVHTAGWSESLAESIFHALRRTLGDKLDGKDTNWAVAFTDAYQTARSTVEDQFRDFLQYAKEHPGEVAAEIVLEIILSLIAFGILVRMAKWVVRILGFADLGPVAGTSSWLSGVVSLVWHRLCHAANTLCFQGSFAARWEARYAGYIPKGSWFAFCQRMGMT